MMTKATEKSHANALQLGIRSIKTERQIRLRNGRMSRRDRGAKQPPSLVTPVKGIDMPVLWYKLHLRLTLQ